MHFSRFGGAPPDQNPFRLINLPDSEQNYKWMFSFTQFPLDKLKHVRRLNGNVQMTALIWAILNDAMLQYLLAEQDKSLEDVPEYIFVATTFPWPQHPAKMEESNNNEKICNHW